MKDIKPMKILKGVIFCAVICMIAVLILAAVSSFASPAQNIRNIIIFACLGIGVFLSAIAIAKSSDTLGAVHALLVGVFTFLLIFIISAIVNARVVFNTHIFTLLAVCILCGLLGGILGNQSSRSF